MLLALFFLGMLVVVLWFSWLFVGPLFRTQPRAAGDPPRRRGSVRRLIAAAVGVVVLAATAWATTRPGVFGVPLVMWPLAAAGTIVGVVLLVTAVAGALRRPRL